MTFFFFLLCLLGNSPQKTIAQSAEAVEHTDSMSAEG